MKSEHRHELKTNELAQWIANFPQWAKKNMRTIIYVAVLAVVVVGLYGWKIYQKDVIAAREQVQLTRLLSELTQKKQQVIQAHAQGQDYSFVLIQVANDLDEFAQTAKNQQAASLALIKKAEAMRTELHYRLIPADKENAAEQINRAKSDYSKAIEKAGANPSLKAAATYGLGLCEEELGNFDQAKQIYQQLTDEPNFQRTVAANLAENRLKVMDEYKKGVAFKEAPIKPVAEIEPAAFDVIVEPDVNQ